MPSVDAAFRYRTSAATIEIALIEWKYTESYLNPKELKATYVATRKTRYGPAFGSPSGPIKNEKISPDAMLQEPFYQLMRQQLLACQLEQDHVGEASTVRVIHVLSPHNAGYQQSLPHPEHRAIGDTVDLVWTSLLRNTNRFIHVDPARFLNAAITSNEYVARYQVTE